MTEEQKRQILIEPTINLLEQKFRIHPDYLIEVEGKHKNVSSKPPLDNLNELFEKDLLNDARINKLGFIEREIIPDLGITQEFLAKKIAAIKEHRDVIGKSNQYWFNFLTAWINFLDKKNAPPLTSVKDNFTTSNWFKVGLLFANGEMDILRTKFNNNATQISKHLYGDKWGSYRPYISESIAKTTNKNIFSNQSKLQKINDYCISENIPRVEGFIKHLNPSV
jgi:hypothetical protein